MAGRGDDHVIAEILADGAVRIPTRSGVELGATVTRPATVGRFPALVWYDPYRAAWDGTAGAPARYFAARGYAFVNLHARGSGNSSSGAAIRISPHRGRRGWDECAGDEGHPERHAPRRHGHTGSARPWGADAAHPGAGGDCLALPPWPPDPAHLNGSDFPNVWPTPLVGTGSVHLGPGSEATLGCRSGRSRRARRGSSFPRRVRPHLPVPALSHRRGAWCTTYWRSGCTS